MSGQGAIRVLHLRDSPWVDGPGRTIIESAAHFDPRVIDYHIGVMVPVAGASHPMIEEGERRGLQLHAIADRGGLDREAIASIVDLVDRLQIDIVHTSDFRTRVYGGLARRRRSTLGHVTTTHGWIANTARERLRRLLDKALLRSADHVVMVSRAMRELVPRWWLPERRVTILHNAIVSAGVAAAQAEPSRRAPDVHRRVNLLNVGRLSPEKGQDLLLHAVARLREDFPGIRVHFAGIGPRLEPLQALARALGLADRVTFLGYVENMRSRYADMDLVVQSSLTEGLPNVMLEAALYGVPVVATDVGGTREVIRHGGNGWLVRAGSVDELVAGLRRYLSGPQEFIRMAQSGRSRIAQEFSYAARTAAMARIYAEVRELRR
jgi:glycosyltransferase involved in cell wall biosynthesis